MPLPDEDGKVPWWWAVNRRLMRKPWRERLAELARQAKLRGDEDYLQELRDQWAMFSKRERGEV